MTFTISKTAISIDSVVSAIREVLPTNQCIALHEPTFAGREWEYVKDCLDSGWVSYAGQYVDRFERMLEEITGARHAVAMSSGTVAIQMALVSSNFKPGDEVLMPALTFVATANAVVHAGGTPHFIDNECATLGVAPDRLGDYLAEIVEVDGGEPINRRTGKRIAAIIPMHTFGHPVDMDSLIPVAEKYGINVIEDAAESLGSLYKGKGLGGIAKAGVLSFNGNKIATTGGGGALLTNDPALAKRAKHISTTAKLPHKWEFRHDEVGYNFRMPSLNAALGCAQLEQLPTFVAKKRVLAARYKEALASVSGVDFFEEPSDSQSNYWLNALLIKPELAEDFCIRDAILEALNNGDIMARPAWTLMHRLPMFTACPRMDLEVAESLERRIVNLPSSVSLVEHI